MGFGGISVWSLLLILVIVLLLFGTKKLRNVGTDLGGAIKGFKDAMNNGQKEAEEGKNQAQLQENQEEQEASGEQSQAADQDDKQRS